MREEAFGPVLPLLRFTGIDEVIARANDTQYGLAGSVWGRDVAGARAIADRLESLRDHISARRCRYTMSRDTMPVINAMAPVISTMPA